MSETPSVYAVPGSTLPSAPALTRPAFDPQLSDLARLSAAASEDWAVQPGWCSGGSVVGGPLMHYTGGSGRGQIASFSVPRLPDDDPRDPAALQAGNAEFAVACVRYVRGLLLREGLASARSGDES